MIDGDWKLIWTPFQPNELAWELYNLRNDPDEVSNLIEDESLYSSMATAENPYGDGQAAGRIIQIPEDYFQTN